MQNRLIALVCVLFLAGSAGCLRNDVPQASDGATLPTEDSAVYDNDRVLAALKAAYLNESRDPPHFDPDFIEEQDWTFADVHQHFQQNCVPCHNNSGYAPFELTSYRDIRKRSKAIREALETMLMPPWPADTNYTRFCNEQTLPASVRSQLIQWIDQGAKLGADNTSLIDVPPVRLNQPDLVIEAPLHHTITSDSDTYVCFIFDPHFENDTFVNAIEFFSDNPETLHHLTLYLDTNGVVDDKPDCWVCDRESILGELAPLDAWVKGLRPVIYREGLSYRFPKGSKFLLQTHYEGDRHKGKKEKTGLGFHFTPPPKQEIKWTSLQNFDIFLPANQVTAQAIVHVTEKPFTVLGFYPHMHFLGKKAEVFARTEAGDKIPLLSIPKWDYLLQTKYMLETPIHLPAGSTIYMNAVFDNTEDNPEQPNFPIRDVRYNLTAYEEMLVLGLFYTTEPDLENTDCIVRLLE